MSYSIIFETKIIKLKDGRLLHLDLSGCNNDTAGRRRDEFTGTIIPVKDFLEKAEKYKENSTPSSKSDGFDLKIGSRWCTFYDYGEHLLRMLKKAETWDEFANQGRFVRVTKLEKIEVYKEDGTTIELSVDEFCKFFEENRMESFRYRKFYKTLKSEEEIITALENDEYIIFDIGRKKH